MKKFSLLLVAVMGLTLLACGSARTGISSNPEIASVKSQPTATQTQSQSTAIQPQSQSTAIQPQSQSTAIQAQSGSEDLVRTDNQGAVTFSVQPLNLYSPGDSMNFEVSMNTHSVDLSMDLATLAILTTDNGASVSGLSWDAPAGGHHVSGTLSFPASNAGKPILDGAAKLTLIIKNIDAPERTFTWDLP
jgi:hypothetical protein